jgi:hemolysin III
VLRKLYTIFIAKAYEPVSGYTHAAGALASIVGLVFLLHKAVVMGNATHITAFSIFGTSMILLYSASALYHLLPVSDKARVWLRKLDHAMIYVLIAGTYTPVTLLVLDGAWSWGMFFGIWGLALIGITVKLAWFNAPRWISTVFYLFLGWLAVIMIPELIELSSIGFLTWIGIGGAAYTIGAIIYGTKKPDPIPNVFGFHEIWHLFVMAGTFAHFWAIYDYITIVS